MIKCVKTQPYKINYSYCNKKGQHQGEPLNVVCLEESCAGQRLICSICQSENHAQHKVQPLKFYFDNLATSFAQQKFDLKEKLDELQDKRSEVLVQLRETVTAVAERFRQLEIQIVQRFKSSRDMILEEDMMRKSLLGIQQLLTTPNHPDLEHTISKYMKKLPTIQIPGGENLDSLRQCIVEQIRLSISFYADQKATVSFSSPTRFLYPSGMVLTSETLEQMPDNNLNMVLLNEPITLTNHRVKIKIMTDNIKIYMGVITMGEFKKCAFLFDPLKANGNFLAWISNDGKGNNYTSNTINGMVKDDVFDLSLKKGQLVVNKKKAKQFATLNAKDLGVDWYFFFAIIGQGKVHVSQKSNKV